MPNDPVAAAMLLAFLRTSDSLCHRWGLAHAVLALDPSRYWWYDAKTMDGRRRYELELIIRAHGRKMLLHLYPQALTTHHRLFLKFISKPKKKTIVSSTSGS